MLDTPGASALPVPAQGCATCQGWHCPLTSLHGQSTAWGLQGPLNPRPTPPQELFSGEGWRHPSLEPSNLAQEGSDPALVPGTGKATSGSPKTSPEKLCQALCEAQSCCPCLFVLPVGAAEKNQYFIN